MSALVFGFSLAWRLRGVSLEIHGGFAVSALVFGGFAVSALVFGFSLAWRLRGVSLEIQGVRPEWHEVKRKPNRREALGW